MRQNTRIFVEGEKDKYFLDSYIQYLDCHGFVAEIKSIRGLGNLAGHCPRIEQHLDRGERVLIIFDADEDCRGRIYEIEEVVRSQTAGRISRRNSDLHIFLFPDNQGPGKVESLLKKIVKMEHEKVFDCFESYKKCLKEKDVSYQLPDIKGKIYSYKEALGLMKQNKENRFDPKYWDFQNSSLDPLKFFLLENLKEKGI